MKILAKKLLNSFAAIFGVVVVRSGTLVEMEHATRSQRILNLLTAFQGENSRQLLDAMGDSRSQLQQDLFVLAQLDFKKGGYFVEFGATDGIELSNTFLLEKKFGWTGILAEPAECWQEALRKNRSAKIERKCVWSISNQILVFNEVEYAELSTVDLYSRSDIHKGSREKGRTYNVETISLIDLLEKHNAPENIDYLSIDTEGSEFEILSEFDFSKYSFDVITCEHNGTANRVLIYDLLTKNGCSRKFEALSEFDDWYVKN